MNDLSKEDIRWKQRFNNYIKALQNLRSAIEINHMRPLSFLEEQGLIQAFEITQELGWNLLKDYLEFEGITQITGARTAIRQAFKRNLIADGEIWIAMIESRNLTSHSYNKETADEIMRDILSKYYPAFEAMAHKFTQLSAQD